MVSVGRLFWLAVVLGLASGCASKPDARANYYRTPNVSSDAAERASSFALDMVGKPYHYGGNSPNVGFDCSGLVQYSYGRAGVSLPHGTDHLMRLSRPVSLSSLRRGDLLFFDQERKSSHVAIYVGDDRFVHAPSSGKIVHVGRLDSDYWRRHLNEVRRLGID